MYRKNRPEPTQLKVNTSYEGETIEEKISRIINNKEPIKDAADIIYTDRAKGVEPAYDIRTDRWEVAVEATSMIDKTYKAQREKRIKARTETKDSAENINKTVDGKKEGGTQSAPGTTDTTAS